VGKNDKIFPPDGANPYKRDLPEIEFHLIDTGHFVLEDKADEVVPLIRVFAERKRSGSGCPDMSVSLIFRHNLLEEIVGWAAYRRSKLSRS
jgi:hypothetical protein